MKENKTLNARFSCILIQYLDDVMTQIVNQIQEQKIYNKPGTNYKTETEEILEATYELLSSLDRRFHKEDLAEGSIYASQLLNKVLSLSNIDESQHKEKQGTIQKITGIILQYIDAIKPSIVFLQSLRLLVRLRYLIL